jgi:hypothetical protein
VELQRRLAPLQQQSERDSQQNLEFQDSNHALTMELTALYAVDQGPRDLFPPEWEDHRDFEAGTVIYRRGPAAGSYTEIRVDVRQNNVSFPTASTALPTRHSVGQLGAASSASTPRAYMRERGWFRPSWDGQPPFDSRRPSGHGGAPSYLPTYESHDQEHSRAGPRYTVREQSVVPIDVSVYQNATLFAKLHQAQQYVEQRIETEDLSSCRCTPRMKNTSPPSSWVLNFLRHLFSVVLMPWSQSLQTQPPSNSIGLISQQ